MNNEDIENDIFKVSGVSNVISKQKELFAANDNYFSSEEYKQQHLSYYQSLNSTEDDLVSYFNKNYLDSFKQNDLANIKKQKQSELLELSEYNSMSAWDKYSASVDANSLTYNIVMKAMDVKDYVTSNYDETYTIDSKLKDLSLYSNKNNRDGLSDLQIEEILHNARNKQHLQRLVTLEIMKNQNLASRRRMEKYGGTIGNLGYTMAGYITDPLNIIGSSFAYGVRFAKGSTKTKMAIGGAYEGAYESALYGLDADEDRTVNDILLTMTAGAVLSGGLSKLGKAYSNTTKTIKNNYAVNYRDTETAISRNENIQKHFDTDEVAMSNIKKYDEQLFGATKDKEEVFNTETFFTKIQNNEDELLKHCK